MTNEELLQKAGVGDLQDTVATRLRRFIGHVLRLPTSRPASLVLDWTPEVGRRRWGRPKRIHLQRICERWVSVAVALMMRLEVLPVTVPDETTRRTVF